MISDETALRIAIALERFVELQEAEAIRKAEAHEIMKAMSEQQVRIANRMNEKPTLDEERERARAFAEEHLAASDPDYAKMREKNNIMAAQLETCRIAIDGALAALDDVPEAVKNLLTGALKVADAKENVIAFKRPTGN